LDQTLALQALGDGEPTGETQQLPDLPQAVGELAQDLRDAEDRLARRDDRLSMLTLALESARATELQLRESTGRDIAAARAAAQEEVLREREQAQRLQLQLQGELQAAVQQRAALAEKLQALELQSAQGVARADDLARHLTQLRAELDSERSSATAVRRRLDEEGVGSGQLLRQLTELRASSERQLEALRSVEGFRALGIAQIDARDSRIDELEEQLRQHQAAEAPRRAERESLLRLVELGKERSQAQLARIAQLTTERDELVVRVAGLQSAQQDAAAQAATELAAREAAFARSIAEQQAIVTQLQDERASLGEHVVEREQDLLAAAEQIGRVEADRSQRATRLEELERGNEALAQRLADARRDLAAREARLQQLESQALVNAGLLASLHQTIQRLGRDEPAAVGAHDAPPDAQRELLLQIDGEERVFPLGRRTTVGRTLDNDISLDTGFISRHHAVLLSSSRHTILEDLNSTNGVRVNGRRIVRQVLHDGDMLTIGTTEFRYRVCGITAASAPLP
jgi:hypothetical protein